MDYKEWRWVALMTLALLIISSLPYLVAWAVMPEGTHFTGLVFNFTDGHSYIAKMRQGLDGSWRFRLNFTPEQRQSTFLFLFHLGPGHLVRRTGLSLAILYHGARVLVWLCS